MSATVTKTQTAQVMGVYQPTEIDAKKAAAEFLIQDCYGTKTYIRWADGRGEMVTARQLNKLQAAHSWATDF